MAGADALTSDPGKLLRFIRGEGHPYGRGIWTHPAASDAQERAKHEACLELERRGLIVRRIDKPTLVSWMPE